MRKGKQCSCLKPANQACELETALTELKAQLAQAQALIPLCERYRSALEWYADETNYYEEMITVTPNNQSIQPWQYEGRAVTEDGGFKAREALKEPNE